MVSSFTTSGVYWLVQQTFTECTLTIRHHDRPYKYHILQMGLIPRQLTLYQVKDKSSEWEVLRERWWGKGHGGPESSSEWDNALWAAEVLGRCVQQASASVHARPSQCYHHLGTRAQERWESTGWGKDGQERPRWRWGTAFQVKGHLWKHRWQYPHGALRGALSLVQLKKNVVCAGPGGKRPKRDSKGQALRASGLACQEQEYEPDPERYQSESVSHSVRSNSLRPHGL